MYINPYSQINNSQGLWLRANFHTHAGTGKNTCGTHEIDEVVASYKEAGYGLLTISNHDLFSDVGEYAKKHDIVLINGFEYSSTPHMLCIGNTSVLSGTHQQVIDECLEQGGFVILCHPNWIHKEYWPWKDIDATCGYTGIEIYNGVIFRLSGSGLATDTWDYLLSQGKLVWGFANDDFHRWFDMAKGWNMIFTPSEGHQDIKESIRNGWFYASTGLFLNEFIFDRDTILITASSKDNYVKNYEYVFIGQDRKVLDKQMGESGKYKMSGNELYVRVQVISEHGAMLWTQPIYRSEMFRRP